MPAKKTTTKKKTTTRKPAATAKGRARKTTTKAPAKARVRKPVKKKSEKELFVMGMGAMEKSSKLPEIDLDRLDASVEPLKPVETEACTPVGIGSRVAFYLGIFFGAIVINVFFIAILAIIST